jgi:hypothetical protein
MDVGSAIEIYTSVLGWMLYDRIWEALTDTGLVYLPFVELVVKNFAKPYVAQGANGAAETSIRMMEMDLIAMFTVAALAGAPMITLKIGDLGHTTPCGGPSVTGANTRTTYDQAFAAIGGQTAIVPVWWYGVLAIASGINEAVIASVPCTADIRTLDYRLDNTRIQDPELRRQVQLFANDCWLPARSKFLARHDALPAGYPPDDIDWIGSRYFQDTNGYYGNGNLNLALRASEEIPGFPYDAARDTEYQAGFIPLNGRPECKTWWQDGVNGLRKRLLATIDPDVLAQSVADARATNPTETDTSAEDALIRKLFEQERGQLAAPANRSDGATPSIWSQFTNELMGTISGTGLAFEYLTWQPKLYALRQAAPIGQSFILMAIYLLLPFVLVFSSFSLGTMLFLSIVLFALKFCTAIWSLATWLDTNMIRALGLEWWKYQYDVELGTATLVANLAAGLMFVVIPLVWFMLLGWAGYRIGSGLEAITKPIHSAAESGASKGSNMATRTISRGTGSLIGRRK